jgi:hypothetical protein
MRIRELLPAPASEQGTNATTWPQATEAPFWEQAQSVEGSSADLPREPAGLPDHCDLRDFGSRVYNAALR